MSQPDRNHRIRQASHPGRNNIIQMRGHGHLMQITRKEMSESVYCFLLILWSAFTTITVYTTIPNLKSLHLELAYTVVRIAVLGLLISRMLIYVKKYSLRQFCIICLLVSVVIITLFYTRYDYFYPIIFFIISSYRIDLRKALKQVLNAQIVIAVAVITLAVTGIIPDNILFRGSIQRHAAGYSHPNTLGSIFLAIALLSFYLYRREHQKRLYITLIICFAITNYVAHSRTSASLILVILIVQIISIPAGKQNSIRTFAHCVLRHSDIGVWVIALLNIVAAWKNVKIAIGDATFKVRFFYASNYLKRYGIHLFGQDLYFGDDDIRILPDWKIKNALGTLDNSYVFLLVGFGLVGALLFMFAYTARIRMAEKEGDYALITVFLIYAIDGIAETAMIRCYFNYFMLLFADLIWQEKTGHRYKLKFRRRHQTKECT